MTKAQVFGFRQPPSPSAVKHYAQRGPCFGRWLDISISDDCNSNQRSYAAYSGKTSFEIDGRILSGSQIVSKICSQAVQYLVKNYEVFQVKFS
jgi:hypothetical protein